MTIVWCMVPEISGAMDRTFCHFGPFSALLSSPLSENSKFWKNEKNTWRYYFTHVYHKWQSYDVWFLRYVVWRTGFFFLMTPEVCSDWLLRYAAWETEFSVILNHFEPFYPPKNLKNQNFKKMKETPGDIIILHKCTKFIIICYTVPEIRCLMDVILIFYFGLFFALLPPNSPKNQNFKKMKKTPGDIIILHMCAKNNDHMMYDSWNYYATDGHTDGQMDRWKKWHIEVRHLKIVDLHSEGQYNFVTWFCQLILA